MDYLDRLIQLSHVKGEINVLCRFQGEWKIAHQKTSDIMGIFHIVSKGECFVSLENDNYHLKSGDVVFLPYGAEHVLGTTVNSESIKIKESQFGAFTLHTNTEEASHDFEMFCGYFRYLGFSANPLFTLPKWHLSGDNDSVMALLGLLRKETQRNLGSKIVVDSLCNVLFTYLIRDYLEQNRVETEILALLQDKRLKNAVDGMLKEPEKNWSMERLAADCSMSRASFIRLFKQKTGMSAGKFLTVLRMNKAGVLLKTTNKSVFTVALETGYQSEAHFSKIFKAYYGVSPGKYRAD